MEPQLNARYSDYLAEYLRSGFSARQIDNLLMANPHATFDQVVHACKMAEIHSSINAATAEHFAATINQLKGKVTMMFITHAMPKNLLVDEVVRIGLGSLNAVNDTHGETKKDVEGGVHG